MLRPVYWKKFLVEAGALPEHDDRPPSLRTFDADRYADLLAEIPMLVGPIEMQTAIGATKAQLRSLPEDGILIPRTYREKVNSPWLIADGIALIDELDAISLDISEDDQAWEDVQSASKRTRLRVGDIITAVRQAKIQMGKRSGGTGYRSFVVQKSEVDNLVRGNIGILPQSDSVRGRRTASVFARELGIRTEGWYQALVEAGHCTGSWEQHPVTNVRTLYVSDDDVHRFNSRFITLRQMQVEFGIHKHTCLSKLRAALVRPFATKTQGFGPLYERDSVESVLLGRTI